MSDLEAILEWQNQQIIAKNDSIRSLFIKGEGSGHDFRGNQWIQEATSAAQDARSLGRLLDKIAEKAGDLSPVIQRHLALAEKHLAIATGLKQTDSVSSRNHEKASKAHRDAAISLSEGRNYSDSHKAISGSVMSASIMKSAVRKGLDESLADILRHDQDHDDWHAKHGDPPCKSEADCARMRAKYAEVKAEEAVSKGGEGSGVKGHTTDRPEPARQVDAGRNSVVGRFVARHTRSDTPEHEQRVVAQATKETIKIMADTLHPRNNGPENSVTDLFGIGKYKVWEQDARIKADKMIRQELQGVIDDLRSGTPVVEKIAQLGRSLEGLKEHLAKTPDANEETQLRVKVYDRLKTNLEWSWKVANNSYKPTLAESLFNKQDTPIEKGGVGSGRFPAGSGDANLTPSGHRPIGEIASDIIADWKNPYFGAKPYLDAMFSLSDIKDNYGLDSARSIVSYFIANASQWKGETAKAIKAELKKIVNTK